MVNRSLSLQSRQTITSLYQTFKASSVQAIWTPKDCAKMPSGWLSKQLAKTTNYLDIGCTWRWDTYITLHYLCWYCSGTFFYCLFEYPATRYVWVSDTVESRSRGQCFPIPSQLVFRFGAQPPVQTDNQGQTKQSKWQKTDIIWNRTNCYVLLKSNSLVVIIRCFLGPG